MVVKIKVIGLYASREVPQRKGFLLIIKTEHGESNFYML